MGSIAGNQLLSNAHHAYFLDWNYYARLNPISIAIHLLPSINGYILTIDQFLIIKLIFFVKLKEPKELWCNAYWEILNVLEDD